MYVYDGLLRMLSQKDLKKSDLTSELHISSRTVARERSSVTLLCKSSAPISPVRRMNSTALSLTMRCFGASERKRNTVFRAASIMSCKFA